MTLTIHEQKGVQMPRDVMAELTAFVGSLENWEMDLSFDPDDPASVEAAIAAMEEAIDNRAYRFPGNDPVMNLAEQMNVYGIDRNGTLNAVITDLVNPNGLAFSPDESKLYVVEWRGTPNRSIWSFDVGPDGSLRNKTKLIDAAN